MKQSMMSAVMIGKFIYKRFSCLNRITQCNFTLESFSSLQQSKFKLLPLHVGDRVQVIASEKGKIAVSSKTGSVTNWYYGCLIDDERECGIFPRESVTEPLELTSSSTESNDLATEITDVLKEWWTCIKETYGKQARMDSQDEILQYMEELMVMRKKILTGNITMEELKEMRLQLVKKIDLGNQWLGLDMVIRDDSGKVIEGDSISVGQAYRAHLAASTRILNDSEPKESTTLNAFSLLIKVLSVYIDCKESFVFYWNSKNGALSSRNCQALFKDLGAKELGSSPSSNKEHRVLLYVRVAYFGLIESSSSTMKKQVEVSSSQLFCRQPYGAAIIELAELAQSFQGPKDYTLHLIRETSHDQLAAKNDLLFGNSVSKTFTDPSVVGHSKLMISAEVLPGYLSSFKKMYPHIFTLNSPMEVPKMSFPDIISADETRNDLYITLLEADFRGGKSSDANIEARVTPVDSRGIIKDVNFMCVEINTSTGLTKKTTYHSLVFYHEDKPKWNEAVKISIPEDSRDIHLRITFHYRKSSEKAKQEKGPFALAFVRILNDARLIEDGRHDLLVYRIDSGKFSERDSTYLDLPSTRQEKEYSQTRYQQNSFSLASKHSMTIYAVTCSTTLTQNQNLLDILKWKSNVNILEERLIEMSGPTVTAIGDELVKFIPNYCDSLFEILLYRSNLDELIFNAFVSFTQLLNEKRFKNFKPVLQNYIENFHSTDAFEKLIPILCKRINTAERNHELTLNALKTIGIIVQLIVRSKNCSDRLRGNSANFENLICNLFNAFVSLMQSDKDSVTTCQNMALKHLPAIIPHLSAPGVFDQEKLNTFIVQLFDNLGKNISSRCKLNFIKDVVNTNYFLNGNNREKLLPKILESVIDELEKIDFYRTRDSYLDRNKVIECVNASADIIFDILEQLFPSTTALGINEERGTEFELYFLISTTLRTVFQTTIKLINEKISTSAFCAVTVALLSKISAQMYKNYIDDLNTRIDKLDFLMETVHLFRDLINKSLFPSSWFYMFCLQNKAILKTMGFIVSTMTEHFHSKAFDAKLWREYILTMVAFSTQKGLQIGSSSISRKRSQLLSSQPDLRRKAASDLRSMWFSLATASKNIYIPSLVGSFLQVALIDDDEVRETIIPIFFDMMECEFVTEPCGDFSKFASEMIVQLDCLVDEDRGGQKFHEDLCRIITAMLPADSKLYIEGGKFVDTLDTLLRHLFEYREVRISGYNIEDGMSRTVELLKYYNEIGQPDLYINYVYKLYDLHLLSNNSVEAAFTLMKHAESLSVLWTEDELRPALLNAQLNRHCATQRKLKEALYIEMADLFNKKDMWEDAIVILKELLFEYDNSYEYAKLPNLLNRLAGLYSKVNTQRRVSCTYYLVGYYGQDFPIYLNGKQFVYRGNECEDLLTFQNRMMSTISGSTLVTTMDDCSKIVNEKGKYLQIFPVQPISENLPDKSVGGLILWYYKNNRVKKFEYCRPESRKDTKWTALVDNETTRSWVIRHVVIVKDALPNILRWSQVVSRPPPTECSPLMQAVSTLEKSNDDLEQMAKAVLSNSQESAVVLGGKIRGVVQAWVQGGTKNYDVGLIFLLQCASNLLIFCFSLLHLKILITFFPQHYFILFQVFFNEEFELTDDEKQLVRRLKHLLKDLVRILEFALYVYGSREDKVAAAFRESLVSSFLEYKNSIEERFGTIVGIFPSQLSPGCSIYPRTSQGSKFDRRTTSLDASSSIASVFRFGGQYASKSGRSTPRKSSAFRADSKSSFDSNNGKRISTSSERSIEATFFVDADSLTPRSTVDFSLSEGKTWSNRQSEASIDFSESRSFICKRTSEQCPPPLPPRTASDVSSHDA
uniref:Dedicator of cytokinesis protein 1 n=1 Tax=Syphacia muris TaxID=451379 RepID=A0A0N5AJX3_9BILA